jgi:hypothetical protein
VLRDKTQVATLLIECRPERAPTQSEGRIALPEGAAPK